MPCSGPRTLPGLALGVERVGDRQRVRVQSRAPRAAPAPRGRAPRCGARYFSTSERAVSWPDAMRSCRSAIVSLLELERRDGRRDGGRRRCRRTAGAHDRRGAASHPGLQKCASVHGRHLARCPGPGGPFRRIQAPTASPARSASRRRCGCLDRAPATSRRSSPRAPSRRWSCRTRPGCRRRWRSPGTSRRSA